MSAPIAVIGAGMAGAAAARTLADGGHQVTLFDKSRGVGGRMATRRREDASGAMVAFDHGAQWTLPREPAFIAAVEAAMASGHAARWTSGPQGAVVGTPGMSALAKAVLGELPLRTGFTVERMARHEEGWRLRAKEGESAGPFRAVILTVPAPQLVPIVTPHNQSFARAATEARYDPCWALMLGFEDSLAAALGTIASDALTDRGIEWLAHDGSKPGRIGATLVAHAEGAWSADNLERDREDICATLTDLVCAELKLPQPAMASAHRWRYSRVTKAVAPAAPFDPQTGLGVAGDWTAGPNIEAAYMSGLRCARAAMEALPI